MIKVIAAMSKNRAIGKSNALLWNLPNDMNNFKKMTMGNCVVMGRKTFESIGKALPGRRNIVITRNNEIDLPGIETASSFNKAMEMCTWNCFIIGGEEIYKLAMPFAEKLYLTIVDAEIEGDAHFPEFEESWVKISDISFDSDDKNIYPHKFIEYEKCKF
jgi:dihydrofolate reductase